MFVLVLAEMKMQVEKVKETQVPAWDRSVSQEDKACATSTN